MRHLSWSQRAGLFLVVEGTAVIGGWLLRVPVWSYVFPSSTAMVLSTALCLVLAGLAMLLPGTRLPADSNLPLRVGWCVALIGAAALVENILPVDLGLDFPRLHVWFTDQNSHPGRMAPNTAAAMMIAGFALMLRTPARRGQRHPLGAALAAIVLTLGVLGLVAYTLLLELAYSWWGFPRMAFSTGIGVIVLGAGLLSEVQEADGSSSARGARMLYAFLGMALTMLLTVMLVSYGSINALLERARWVEHTDQVRAEFETLMSTYNRMHIAWRDFIALNSEGKRVEFESLARDLRPKLLDVTRLLSDSARQTSRLQEMDGLMAEDANALHRADALKREGQLDSNNAMALQLVGINVHRLRIENLAKEIRDEEDRLLAARQKESQETSDSMIVVILSGNAIGFAILLYSLFLLKRQNEQRDRLEISLQGANAELEELYNKAPCGYHTVDREGIVERINDTELAWLGYRREEVVGKARFSDFHTPESAQRVQSHLKEFFREGRVADVEYEFVRKDGSILPVLLNSIAVYDAAGNYVRSQSTVYDLTARKQMEKELHRSNVFLDSLIENIPDVIVVKEARELRYVLVNKAAQQLIGHSQDELIGKTPFDIVPENEAAAAMARDRAVLDGGQVVVFPDSPIRTDRGTRFLHVTKVPLFGAAGTPEYLLNISRDVTDHRRAEESVRELNASLQMRAAQLEATNKELESFSYSVSHDLRAPLRAIDGYALMVEEDYGPLLDAEGARYLTLVREHSKRMGMLIDDLLRFSRLGRQALARVETDMGRLVQEVLSELSHDSSALQVRVEVGPLPSAHADRSLLHQVWINLISNAIKYSSKVASPRVEIEGRLHNGEAIYSVSDNGAGFDMAYYDKLFGVFQRLHRADEFVGTGVGLAIVHRAIIRHGGRVWAEGEVGRGARFHFSLPLGEFDE